MSSRTDLEEFAPLSMGKGNTMRTFIDHSKPIDSPERVWVEVIYDGKEDSEVLNVPNHWHKEHDEIMEVLEGKILLYLDGKEIPTSAGDPPVLIPKGHVHGFKIIPGKRMRATERTLPAGDYKPRFFHDMLQTGGMPGPLLMMRAMTDGDMYPSLPGGWKRLDWLLVTVLGSIARPFVAKKPASLKKKDG